MPDPRARIILYIDPETYLEESEHPLTEADLEQIGFSVNEDAGPICGYEAWEVVMPGESSGRARVAS